MTRQSRVPRAFTLVELIATLAVLAALAALGNFAYQQLIEDSRDNVARLLLGKIAEQGLASHVREDAPGGSADIGFVEDGRDFSSPVGGDAGVTIDGHTVSFPTDHGSTTPNEVSVVVADTDVHLSDQVALRRGDLAGLAMRSWSGRCIYAAASSTGDIETWIGDKAQTCEGSGALAPLGVVGWYGGTGDPDADGGNTGSTAPAVANEPLVPDPAPAPADTAPTPSPEVIDAGTQTPGATEATPTWDCDNPSADGSDFVLWARSWNVDDIVSARVDAGGSMYVSGTYGADGQPVTIGGITLTPADESESFVAKINPDSTLAWIAPVGGPGRIDPAGVSVDHTGYVYLAAAYTGRVEVGGFGAASAGGWDIVTARISPDGHVEWIRSYGGEGTDIPNGLDSDAGNLVLSGSYTGTPHLGGTLLPNRGGQDAFVAYVKSNGAVDWVRSWGGAGTDTGGGVSRTNNGSLLVTGTFDADTTWGAAVIPRAGAAETTDILLATLDRNGNLYWSSTVAGTKRDAAPRASFDQASFYYLTGVFSNTTKIQQVHVPSTTSGKKGSAGGNQVATFTELASLTSAGGTDAFVVKFTKDGALEWAERFGGTLDDESADFAGNADTDGQDGDVYVVGTFRGTATFGSTGATLSTAAGDPGDVWIAKIERNGGVVWVRRVGGSSLDLARVVTAGGTGQGNLYIASQYRGGTTYGAYDLVSDGEYDMVVARLDIC